MLLNFKFENVFDLISTLTPTTQVLHGFSLQAEDLKVLTQMKQTFIHVLQILGQQLRLYRNLEKDIPRHYFPMEESL